MLVSLGASEILWMSMFVSLAPPDAAPPARSATPVGGIRRVTGRAIGSARSRRHDSAADLAANEPNEGHNPEKTVVAHEARALTHYCGSAERFHDVVVDIIRHLPMGWNLVRPTLRIR